MKERPILFNAAMVNAILNGSKTQTRRIINSQPYQSEFEPSILHFNGLTKKRQVINGKSIPKGEYWSGSSTVESYAKACPFGYAGDQLWVRETFSAMGDETRHAVPIFYRADRPNDNGGWTPSIHMPRWASRLNLKITGIRVERLNDISEADAVAEGVKAEPCDHARRSCEEIGCYGDTAKGAYQWLWESINGAGSWAANPWVWVIEFEVLK